MSTPSRKRRGRRSRSRTKLWIHGTLAVVVVIAVAVAAATGTLPTIIDRVEEAVEDFRDGDLDLPGSSEGSSEGSSVSADVDPERAREMLDELAVEPWRDMAGYERGRFSHWRTVDGCDARQTVLARDGEDIETEPDSCRVVSGEWYSPFDDETLTDPSDIDIDHIVPLANAWRTGAAEWDDDRRADFANDLDTPQLIAVSASSNRAKGDQDPSQWQPVRQYWCQYGHDWIVVKHHWELAVTEEEAQALRDMLDTCD